MKKTDLVFYLWSLYLRYMPTKTKYRSKDKQILTWRHKLRIQK